MRNQVTTIILFVSALVLVGAIYISGSHTDNQYAGQKMNMGRTGDIVAPDAKGSSNPRVGSTETKREVFE
ncbi:hypothetical protein KA183_07960 [bacterium]|nr:hypothetical protein [bacterium]QQR58398.1 MAG: hypothetical protein IPG59_02565 [Candidatus Melainabacteria bacterium]